MPLSVEAYVNRHGAQCPVCGSTAIDTSGAVEVDDGATQRVSCETCGATWVDIYVLAAYDALYDRQRRPIPCTEDAVGDDVL